MLERESRDRGVGVGVRLMRWGAVDKVASPELVQCKYKRSIENRLFDMSKVTYIRHILKNLKIKNLRMPLFDLNQQVLTQTEETTTSEVDLCCNASPSPTA